MTENIRVAFEAQYKSGDDFSDVISLGRRDDGEYEQALARLCFKWFIRGQEATLTHRDQQAGVAEEAIKDKLSFVLYDNMPAEFTDEAMKRYTDVVYHAIQSHLAPTLDDPKLVEAVAEAIREEDGDYITVVHATELAQAAIAAIKAYKPTSDKG